MCSGYFQVISVETILYASCDDNLQLRYVTNFVHTQYTAHVLSSKADLFIYGSIAYGYSEGKF